MVDVNTEHLRKASGIRESELNKYVHQRAMVIRRGEHTGSEKIVLHVPLVVIEVKEWAAALQEFYPQQTGEGVQGWLDRSYDKLVTVVRKAIDEIEPQREAKRGGHIQPLDAHINRGRV